MEQQQNRIRRISLTFTPTEYQQLLLLATLTNKLPAVAARDVITDYISAHKEDLAVARQLAEDYQAALRNLNAHAISLFRTGTGQVPVEEV